jgi:hypothetical protein
MPQCIPLDFGESVHMKKLFCMNTTGCLEACAKSLSNVK